MRAMWVWLLAAGFTGALWAGDYVDEVKDLGDNNKSVKAYENIVKGGDDAIADVLEGFKEEHVEDAVKNAAITARIHDCARILGQIGDKTAVEPLLERVKAESSTEGKYIEIGADSARSLGKVLGRIGDHPKRGDALTELKRLAGGENIDVKLRFGAMEALRDMREGGEEVAKFLDSDNRHLQYAAIEVVVSSGHKASADKLLALWDAQIKPETEGGNVPLKRLQSAVGLAALFGLASWGDKRASAGLVFVATKPEYSSMATVRTQAREHLNASSDLKAEGIKVLTEILKDDKATNRYSPASVTLGELGADGVKAFLSLADGVEDAEVKKKLEERIRSQMVQLNDESALSGFASAYRKAESGSKLRVAILKHLLRNRNAVSEADLVLFMEIADDTKVEAPDRASAINAWADLKGRDALDDLKRWIADGEGVVRAEAYEAMGRSYIPISVSTEFLKKALTDDYVESRINALRGLRRSTDEKLLDVFVERMDPEKEKDAKVRREAVMSLESFKRNAKLSDEDVLEPIQGRLKDIDADVRSQAVRIVVDMLSRSEDIEAASKVVEDALKDKDPNVRAQAYGQVVMVATSIDPKVVVDAAADETDNRAMGEAVVAVNNLSELPDENVEPLVNLSFRAFDNRARRSMAVELLGKLAKKGQFTKIAKRAEAAINERYDADGNKDLSGCAPYVKVLSTIGDDSQFDLVKKLAEENNIELRRECVAYIQQNGAKEDIKYLKTLREKTDSASYSVRGAIDAAIRTLEDS